MKYKFLRLIIMRQTSEDVLFWIPIRFLLIVQMCEYCFWTEKNVTYHETVVPLPDTENSFASSNKNSYKKQ